MVSGTTQFVLECSCYLRKSPKEFNVNFKTILKWKKRDSVNDNSFGAKKIRTVLSDLEQQAICIFKKEYKS